MPAAPRVLVTMPPIASVPMRSPLWADGEPGMQPSGSAAAAMAPKIRVRRLDEFIDYGW